MAVVRAVAPAGTARNALLLPPPRRREGPYQGYSRLNKVNTPISAPRSLTLYRRFALPVASRKSLKLRLIKANQPQSRRIKTKKISLRLCPHGFSAPQVSGLRSPVLKRRLATSFHLASSASPRLGGSIWFSVPICGPKCPPWQLLEKRSFYFSFSAF